MTDQVDVKEVQWQDLEVAEEQEECQGCFDFDCKVHPVEEQTFQERLAELSANYYEREQQRNAPRGILVISGITEEEFAEAIALQLQESLRSGEFYRAIPVIGMVEAFEVPRSQHEKLENLARQYRGVDFHYAPPAPVSAWCTPSRVSLTGEWGIPNNGGDSDV
jgi:hypothetical protein